MARKKKIQFVMDTDWMFERPIDREHKEYKLLSYFQKMGEKLDKMELYPGFIELSLHLANVQTLIKEKKIIYTNKRLDSVDDELLVKDLKVKNIPELNDEELKEFVEILSYSAPRMLEYFNIAKSVWTIVYENVDIKPNKRAKETISNVGYFYYNDTKENKIYVWEYNIKPAAKGSPESKTRVNLIYSDEKNLTITKIISNLSMWNSENKKLPVFEMISKGEFPIYETLLPIFKRKLISYINQKKISESFKKEKENI
jgi:hypothetical protein